MTVRADRVWRMRRARHHLDATLSAVGAARWTLRFILDDRPLLMAEYRSRELAMDAATARRRELQRAGWNLHW